MLEIGNGGKERNRAKAIRNRELRERTEQNNANNQRKWKISLQSPQEKRK